MQIIKKIVIASHNQGKIAEFRKMLAPLEIEVCSAQDLSLPDVEETGTTFEENSRLKAETLAKVSGLPCLADDSGLCVDALEGRPGVYSARYAPNRNFDIAMSNLIDELKQSGNPDWSAYFSCVLAIKEPGVPTRFYEGRIDGNIIANRRGDHGFGFDPIFVPQGFDQTFAEMSQQEKSGISHRGKAVAAFLQKEFNAKTF